jgi:hypothetical protein
LNKLISQNFTGSAASATGISSAQARAELTSAIKDSASAAFGSGGSGNGLFGGLKKSTAAQPAGGGKALKLGAKSTANEDAFLQQLRTEGERVPIEKVFLIKFENLFQIM